MCRFHRLRWLFSATRRSRYVAWIRPGRHDSSFLYRPNNNTDESAISPWFRHLLQRRAFQRSAMPLLSCRQEYRASPAQLLVAYSLAWAQWLVLMSFASGDDCLSERRLLWRQGRRLMLLAVTSGPLASASSASGLINCYASATVPHIWTTRTAGILFARWRDIE